MSLVAGTNSWATVAEADTYLTDRMDAEGWFDIPETDEPGVRSKETLLISAFHWLMSALDLSASLTSDDVKNAQIEAAWWLNNHYSALDERRAAIFTGVEDFEMSRRSEKLNIANLKVPDFIIGFIPQYSTENLTAELLGHYDI